MLSAPTQESNLELDALLRMGVQTALANSDFATAFETFLAELPQLAPELVALIPPGAERALGLPLFREIWNHTPRPELAWKRLTVPKPERNAQCLCGSGRKYKQCCGPLEGTSPFPATGFSVLGYVLETVPISRYGALPFKQLDPEELAHVASEWSKEGRIEPALQLLEALLQPGNKLDARHEYAFDTLCDLYVDAGRQADRVAIVERVMQSPDRRLRAAAWQRRATLHADSGEHALAWQVFKEAQRIEPDNPSLAHLELVLLANQGRYAEAQSRATFWAKQLIKLGYAGEPIVELMEEVARDPEVLRRMVEDPTFGSQPAEASPKNLAVLAALIERLPEPANHYRLSPQDDSAGPLQPMPELTAIEDAWDGVFRRDEQADHWADTRWLEWLRTHPLAWQHFAVLKDIVGLLQEALFPDDADEQIDRLEETLLGHAVEVLRRVLTTNRAEGLKLEWGWMQNRPALWLLTQLIEISRSTDEELQWLEWLVLTLNPNDNGGYRERLVHAYCEAGRGTEALAVCDRYPNDDLPGILYGRVLALYLLDRRGDAVAALAHATKRLPKVLKFLIAARPKTPALTPGLVTHGGDDEAWAYRMDCRETWEQCNALDWLKQASGRKA